ncbi:MAG TPA: DUF308 domain-containing protein [Verrucomicrobiae bacterium]|nr:DUF308 domain-containing protein [Verrucomicrobiae bacterium]
MPELTHGHNRYASGWSMAWAISLIVFGVLAMGSPELAALAVNIAIGWLFILAGIAHSFVAFHGHPAKSLVWKLLVGVAYVAFGVWLLLHPVRGVAALTLAVAVLFLIEGVLELVLFFQMRPVPGSGWVAFDGLITLVLGLLIYMGWPSSSQWALGILIGVSMIVSGGTRIMLWLAVRNAITHA